MRLVRVLTASVARLVVIMVAVGASVTLPVLTPSVAAPRPVASQVTAIKVSGVDRAALAKAPDAAPGLSAEPGAGSKQSRKVVAFTKEASTTPFRVLGVTWKGAAGPDLVVQVRTRNGGAWSGWQPVEVDTDHAPDPGTAEAAGQRGGTAALVVAPSDGVQLRVDSAGAAPADLQLDLVDPGTSPADAAAGAQPAGSAGADAARPTILTRAAWGADESLRRGTPSYGQAQVALVHHTVSSNTYSSAEVPAILRGIYAFHVNGRGWSDIGYQFLVDRFGRVWEGRYGGVDKAVVGAQAGGFNSGSFGASVVGDFTSASAPTAVSTALARLIAWKFTIHGIPASGTVSINGKTFNRIGGHRDANQTSCPGKVYDRLPAIRADVAAKMGTVRARPFSRSVDAGGTADVLSYPGTHLPAALAGAATVLRSAGPAPVKGGRHVATGWKGLRGIVLTPDVTGDGRADIFAVDPVRGQLRVYAGNGTGGFAGMKAGGAGWGAMTKLVASGDRTGDGRADLLAVRSDGALVLYPGSGTGWVFAGRVVGTNFGAMDSIVGVGDITRDGRPELLAKRRTDGHLMLYPGTADGGIGAAQPWGTGWGSFTELMSGPDLDGDGLPGDLMVRQGDGRMRTFFVDGSGRRVRDNTWGGGWGGLDSLSSGADWDGDGARDIMGRATSTGDLILYSGTGQRDFSQAPVAVQADLSGVNLFRVIGDLTGDGLADAVGRLGNGDLAGFVGRGDGGFERRPARIGAGWGSFNLIEPVGDLSNDGVPDLLARTTGGELRLYAMTRSWGFAWSLLAGTNWQAARSITSTGALNADTNADVVVLTTGGDVRLYRGTGAGGLNEYVVVLTGQSDLVRILGTGDFTGDGPNDILGQTSSGGLYVYPGNGSGGFRPRQPLRAPGQVGRVLG